MAQLLLTVDEPESQTLGTSAYIQDSPHASPNALDRINIGWKAQGATRAAPDAKHFDRPGEERVVVAHGYRVMECYETRARAESDGIV